MTLGHLIGISLRKLRSRQIDWMSVRALLVRTDGGIDGGFSDRGTDEEMSHVKS